MSTQDALGYLAALLVFTTFYMKTMIPLRLVAISSNIAFISYGFSEGLDPVLLLHITLLPLNVYRLVQILRVTRQVEAAANGDMGFASLLPHMTRFHCNKGEMLFKKGDFGDRLYFLASGEIFFPELGEALGPDNIFTAIALLSPEGRRTASAVCASDGVIYSLSMAKLQELYYQDPKLGFTLVHLTSGRLVRNPGHLDSSPIASSALAGDDVMET